MAKQRFIARIAPIVMITLAAIIGFGMIGCEQPSISGQDSNPVADDFNITGLRVAEDTNPKPVSITPKAGKSQGAITTYYEGTVDSEGETETDYPKSTTAPAEKGDYIVTFDVAAAVGFNAASNLSAGTLVISAIVPVDPIADDFDISGHSAIYENGVPKSISITPKAGKSAGTITTHYEGISPTTNYTKTTTAPSAIGSYAVTFDVAAAFGFNAVNGLNAGELVISLQAGAAIDPVLSDFTITGLTVNYDGSSKAVSITPLSGKSQGARTIYYAGITPTNYPKSTTAPSADGSYAVTFDVAATVGFNAVNGLNAGTLVISAINPSATDFTITGHSATYDGSPKAVSITPQSGKSQGARTIYYAGITPTNYPKSTTAPSAAGSYTVTFDVAKATGYNAVDGLSAGTLVIEAPAVVETEKNYNSGPDALTWGTSFNPVALGLMPGNDTTEIKLNWYSSGAATGKVAHVRFVRGTFSAGKELIVVTNGTVAAASTGNTAHKATVTGLKPGESYEYAVSNDGNNWSPKYGFKVPAATGPFKFAVISDPQLTTGNQDANSRRPTGTAVTTTAAGWLATMVKIVDAGVSFIASGGDQVDATGSNENEYNNFFAPPGLRNLPFAPVNGNHDTNVNFTHHFNLPNVTSARNYYYLYNNILFVVLDTSASPSSKSGAQTYITQFGTALTNAKAAHAGKYDWLIVQHHKSTASVATHLADRDIQYYVEAGFETLMSTHKVDFVLAGHDHVYARSYPLVGRADGYVSVPDKSFPAASGSTWRNPGNPVYLTFTTGSGLKYYSVAGDPYSNITVSGVVTNTAYPYLGNITGSTGSEKSTQLGSAAYLTGQYLPVSTAAFVQPYIPSYCIVDVNGKSITFKTYAIQTLSGQTTGKQAWSFDATVPYDQITVTKD